MHTEFQHGFDATQSHRILWGGGYRHAHDQIDNISPGIAFIPATRALNWYNAFVQDEWRLRQDLSLTRGSQGRAQQLHRLRVAAEREACVAGVSRPAGLDRGLPRRPCALTHRSAKSSFRVRAPFLLAGGPDFRSEVSNVYELGYRAQQTRALSYSITGFRHEHQHLRSFEGVPGSMFENRMERLDHGRRGVGVIPGAEQLAARRGLGRVKAKPARRARQREHG